MFHAPPFYKLLGISETVVAPTAYELLNLPPYELMNLRAKDTAPAPVERALAERRKHLRLSTPGLPLLPVIARLEGKLDGAAELLLDVKQRAIYDSHLLSNARRKALKSARARHDKLGPKVLEAINAALAADGTLAEDQRPSLVEDLLAIGVSRKNVSSVLAEIPEPVAAPVEPAPETLSFLAGTVDLVLSQQGLAPSDELQLTMLAADLAIPPETATQIIDERLEAAGCPRADPVAEGRRSRFEEQLRRLYPDRVATPGQRAVLITLAMAQELQEDEAQRALAAYFEPRPPPMPTPRLASGVAPAEGEILDVIPLPEGEDEDLEAIPLAGGEDGDLKLIPLDGDAELSAPTGGPPELPEARSAHVETRYTGVEARPPAPRSAWGLWLGVVALMASAVLLVAVLVWIASMQPRPGQAPPPAGPPDAAEQASPAPAVVVALAERLAATTESRVELRDIVRAAKPQVLAGAFARLTRLAAGPASPESTGAMAALGQLGRDTRLAVMPPEARRDARSALCKVIRTTKEAAIARKARDLLVPLISRKPPFPPALAASLKSRLRSAQDRLAAAAELEKAVVEAPAGPASRR